MTELKLFSAKIDTWAGPVTIRAYDEHDALGLTRALFKVPTDVGITATEVLLKDGWPSGLRQLPRKQSGESPVGSNPTPSAK